MGDNSWRRRLFFWLVRHAWHVPEGERIPWQLIVVRLALMPLDTFYHLMDRHLHIYDYERDLYRIHGNRYTGDFFRFFDAHNVGSTFKFVSIEDGLITVRREHD